MSTSPRRGRKVQVAAKQNSSRTLYIVLGLVGVVAVATLLTIFLNRNTGAAAEPLEGLSSAPVSYETGITPEGFHYKGSPDAPVTVVEYADYQCPACANFALSSLAERIDAELVETGQVQMIYHDFPLPIHPNAPTASQAAYCAGEQGQFWQMHDSIYLTQQTWAPLSQAGAENHFTRIAAGLGLEQTSFASCLTDGQFAEHVGAAYQSAQAAGIPATPTFVVNGQQVAATQLESAIQAALAGQ